MKEGGVMTHVMKDVEVECLPTAIPEKIKVNISELGMGKSIHVKELPVFRRYSVHIRCRSGYCASIHQVVEEKVGGSRRGNTS